MDNGAEGDSGKDGLTTSSMTRRSCDTAGFGSAIPKGPPF